MNPPLRLPLSAIEKRLARRFAQGFLPRGWIDGLILSNDSTDATNDIVIAPGVCRSTANYVDGALSTLARDQMDMEIPVSIIKQLDVAWAPDNYDPDGYSGGGRSGGRSSSSISNTTWHVFVIGSPDMQPDILFHDAANPSAVLPSGYTAYRMIGSLVRASGAILTFVQTGDTVFLKNTILDVSTDVDTAAGSVTLASVPAGIRVRALMNVYHSISTTNSFIRIHPTDLTLATPSQTIIPLASLGTLSSSASTIAGASQFECLTNTSRQIALTGLGNSTVRIATLGWVHPRGRDS